MRFGDSRDWNCTTVAVVSVVREMGNRFGTSQVLKGDCAGGERKKVSRLYGPLVFVDMFLI